MSETPFHPQFHDDGPPSHLVQDHGVTVGSVLKTGSGTEARDVDGNLLGVFGWLTWEMMDRAAFQAMSPSARKVFDRIHREHGAQGGKENGRLKVTWRDFRKAGVQPRRITEAILEVEALGWAIRTFHGRRLCGEDPGAPAQFRLTWLPVFEVNDASLASNDWKRFGDDFASAKRAAEEACSAKCIQRGVQKAHPTGVAEAHPLVDAGKKIRAPPSREGEAGSINHHHRAIPAQKTKHQSTRPKD